MTTRHAARTAVATALGGLGFGLISQGAPDTFGGKTLVAVITSAGSVRERLARTMFEDTNFIAVGIYIERTANTSSTVEDSLDDLALAVVGAIDAIDTANIVFQRSESNPPNRRVDGKMYRYERILFSILDEI